MSTLRAYAELDSLHGLVTTAEAAAALRVSTSSASRTLAGLAKQGRAMRIRTGLWSIGPTQPLPTQIVRDLCRPYPAYVSFLTALNIAGAIDQQPRVVTVASLDRARTIVTSVGTFSVHHLPPPLFRGWDETAQGPIARPEKAIFDLCYISAAARGKQAPLPELDLPRPITLSAFEPWLGQITSRRLRSLTVDGLRRAAERSRAADFYDG